MSGARYFVKLRERQRDAQIKAMRERCKTCHGAGRVPVGGDAWGSPARDAKCRTCNGTGCALPPR